MIDRVASRSSDPADRIARIHGDGRGNEVETTVLNHVYGRNGGTAEASDDDDAKGARSHGVQLAFEECARPMPRNGCGAS